MSTNRLLNMYKWMRRALFLTVPVSMWGIAFWLSSDMIVSLIFGFGVMLPLFEVLPSPHEVRHRIIQEKKQLDTIWFRLI